ncbi:peptidylprolyl isomerase [Clostridium novyi A str. 4552]|uniref:peptidylprolyl isomerase n=1 Tax=Clostridium novyi A str. 4552 TaxID=1444289 RepID=A0A0A0IC53_CLONO|nr:peptidylprolyl isomerase [Clostridium novyi]KGM97140.1 peptidylprolyl isomerase [Clostridium novyi A str. 4552]
MKNIKKLVAAVAMCIFSVSAVGCSMIEKTPEAINKTVVAKVGDKKITKGELDSNFGVKRYAEQFKAQYGDNYAENPQVKEQLKQVKLAVVQQMAAQEALKQEAEKLKLVPKEDELKKEADKKIQQMKKEQNIKTEQDFEKVVKASGFTKEGFENLVKDNIILEKLQNELTKNVKVDEKEMQKYYETHKDKYPKDPKNPTKVHLAHIILQPKSQEDVAKVESEIKSIKEELNKGADFSILAKKYSQDGSKDKGGDLGTVPVVNSGFDEQFMDAALPLKDGQISDPVKTQFGYHVIKMIKKDVKPCKAFAEVKNEINKFLLQDKKDKAIKNKFKQIQDNAKIKVYEDKIS